MLGPMKTAEHGGTKTNNAQQMKMTVFLLPDSDKRCLLVTTAQLLAIVDLLNVELEALTA